MSHIFSLLDSDFWMHLLHKTTGFNIIDFTFLSSPTRDKETGEIGHRRIVQRDQSCSDSTRILRPSLERGCSESAASKTIPHHSQPWCYHIVGYRRLNVVYRLTCLLASGQHGKLEARES